MAIDHGPDHSMTCHARFWFRGNLNRQAMKDAIIKVAQKNPLVAAKPNGADWQPVAFDPESQISWHDAPSSISWCHQNPDNHLVSFLFSEGKLTDLGVEDPLVGNESGFMLVVKYPHTVSDGLGATVFLKQMKSYLDGEWTETTNVTGIEDRYFFGMSRWERLRRWRWDLIRNWMYFVRFPAKWVPPKSSNEAHTSSEIVFERTTVSQAFVNQLRGTARERNCHVNDLLISAFFKILRKDIQSKQYLRLGIPVSMRAHGHQQFCNLVSMIFLDRRPQQIDSPQLLESVTSEMQQVKNRGLGYAMIAFLNRACVARGKLLSMFLKQPGTKTTSVLTNLGKPFSDHEEFRLGDSVLVGTDSIVPIRPGTNLGLSVSEHAGKISLTLRFNSAVCSREQARCLLADFIQECRHS